MRQKNTAYPVSTTDVLQASRGSTKWSSWIFLTYEKESGCFPLYKQVVADQFDVYETKAVCVLLEEPAAAGVY